jgi:hypothetical protein
MTRPEAAKKRIHDVDFAYPHSTYKYKAGGAGEERMEGSALQLLIWRKSHAIHDDRESQ